MAKGSERARDQKRKHGGPRYEGQQWQIADHGNTRFGHARNDSADRMPDLPDTRIESSGERAGMGRGDVPRKLKSRGMGRVGRASAR